MVIRPPRRPEVTVTLVPRDVRRSASRRSRSGSLERAFRAGGDAGALRRAAAALPRRGDARARLPDAVRDGPLVQPELVHELAEGVRLLERAEIGALEVLDERQLELRLVSGLPHHGRDAFKAGHLGRP